MLLAMVKAQQEGRGSGPNGDFFFKSQNHKILPFSKILSSLTIPWKYTAKLQSQASLTTGYNQGLNGQEPKSTQALLVIPSL
jgi:hypothetical protein